MVDAPRYSFPPRERRGLLLGLDGGQLLTVAGGAMVGLVAHTSLGGSAGAAAAVLFVTAGLLAALWTRDGRPLAARAVVAAAWLLRRPGRPTLDPAPTDGHHPAVSRVGRATHRPRPSTAGHLHHRNPARPRGTAPAGIELVEAATVPGEAPIGLVRDRRAGTWAGVVPVRGGSFSLLDPLEQAQVLERWRQVLGTVARPGSPVARIQWVQRSWTEPHGGGIGAPIVHRASWLVLVVGGRPGRTRAEGRPDLGRAALEREMRLLDGQLRAAELQPGPPVPLDELHDLMARAAGHQPTRRARPWPLAGEDAWAAYRADGLWHATFWIAEWPRVPVGPDFLSPLLLSPARTTVSVLMAPVPPDRAMREVRSARTADRADAELRSRAGFLSSARRDRESEGVTLREEELAEGHQDFRFTGYVTVSAAESERLPAACAEVGHAAQAARVELRRLYGRQAEAFTWTLPLGRGLR